MRKENIRLILILVVCLAFVNCHKSYKKLKTIQVDSLSFANFSMPFAITASENYLYLADMKNQTIYKIKDGKIIKEFSRIGKGPGEFITPYGIKYHQQKIFLLDRSLLRISVFTEDFEFLSSFTLESKPNAFSLSDNYIFVNTLTGEKEITVYSHEGKLIKKIDLVANKHSNLIHNSINAIYDETNNSLICGLLKTNKVVVLNESFEKTDTWSYNSLIPDVKSEYREKNNKWQLSAGSVFCSDLLLFKDKLMLLSGGGFTGSQKSRKHIQNMKYFLHILNKEGIAAFELNLPVENFLGYKFTILNKRIYFISPAHTKIYCTSLAEINHNIF